ncbi:MAG: type II CRISPR-associated endonuclease Cas1 [Planctomycetes bacterium]|nr:type II CRISPR-associated endonuclease Cas1 [Planctomycetota bacterium]
MIDLSEEPARLSVRGALLVIERNGSAGRGSIPAEEGGDTGSSEGPPPSSRRIEVTIPLAEIAVLVVSHPCIIYTHAVLSGLAKAGAAYVACDEKHMPTAMLLPMEGHFIQGRRFEQQATVSGPTRKRLWRDIVRAKVHSQARLLARLRGNDLGLSALAGRVRSGDAGNVEAQASRRYWPALFGKNFRRDRFANDQNRFLNYGYAVLRAVLARAVCAAGLHPSLGLHHHNRYDAFRLADDLMEPFRPIVDEAAVQFIEDAGSLAPLDKHSKAVLIGALTQRFHISGESRTLFDVVARTAASLAAVFAGERKNLLLPKI